MREGEEESFCGTGGKEWEWRRGKTLVKWVERGGGGGGGGGLQIW